MILNEIKARLLKSQGLYNDLINALDEKLLSEDLKGLPSNTMGQQCWCVIGARASYLKAVKAGEWSGFECPLEWVDTISKNKVTHELTDTFNNLDQYLASLEVLSEKQISILLDLIEHEVQHHGQLVRYIYGHKIQMPRSWKERYNLD